MNRSDEPSPANPSRESLEELLRRVERAAGPSYALESAIRDALDSERFLAPTYTVSIDSALSLVERKLPGAAIIMGVRQEPNTRPWARVGPWSAPDATGANLPLAILAALLKALIASEGTLDGASPQILPKDNTHAR